MNNQIQSSPILMEYFNRINGQAQQKPIPQQQNIISPQQQIQQNAVIPQQQIEENQIQSSPILMDYFNKINNPELKVEPEESWSQWGLRQGARSAVRLYETAVGLPGDIQKGTENLASYLSSKITGKKTPVQRGLVGELIHKTFPTSENMRQKTIAEFGQYLEPHNESEKFADDVIVDAASNMIGPQGGLSLPASIAKNIIVASGANLAPKVAKEFGVGEKGQEYAKIGTMMALSLGIGKNQANQIKDKLYDQAKSSLPSGTKISSRPLQTKLQNLKRDLSKGTISPSEKFVIDQIEKIQNKMHRGTIGPDELHAIKRNINEELAKFGYATPTSKGGAKNLLAKVNHYLSESMADYGKQNPQWYKYITEADKAHGAIAAANKAKNFIMKQGKVGKAAGVATGVAGPFVIHALTGTLPYAPGTYAAGLMGIKTMQLYHHISKSPVLRKHYMNVVKNAMLQNAPSMNRSLIKLNKGIQDDPAIMQMLETEPEEF